jgi:RNA-directed DNA polymerase
MSRRRTGTPRQFDTPIAQRHLKAEVANCVGGVISPLLANLFMHYAFDRWMDREFPDCPFERYADLCRIRHKSAYADRRIMPTAA